MPPINILSAPLSISHPYTIWWESLAGGKYLSDMNYDLAVLSSPVSSLYDFDMGVFHDVNKLQMN